MSDPVELRAVRARLVARAVGDRRRLERALHDGVQQDLVAISVRLQLVRELLTKGPPAALELLDEVSRDARAALDRLRAVTSDVYPAILDARGLADALREAGRGARGSVRVEVADLRRYPAEVEAAVYFACRAVLDSARPGAAVTIGVRESDGELRLEVEDGGDADLAALEDLVAAAGGALGVEPPSHGGRRLRATIPL